MAQSQGRESEDLAGVSFPRLGENPFQPERTAYCAKGSTTATGECMGKLKVLLTGASGFLGQVLIPRLLESGFTVIGTSRRSVNAGHLGIDWIQMDLSDQTSVMREDNLEELAGIDIIVHAAALYDLAADHDALYRHNVLATAHVMHLARILPKTPHLCLMSTIAVAGDMKGTFSEAMFDEGQSFSDSYASTKFAAEQMVRSAKDIPSRSIVRLGILVGSSIDGSTPKIDGPYYLQRLLHSIQDYRKVINFSRFMPLPFDEKSRLFLVPVDYAAIAVEKIIRLYHQKSGVHVFHVTGEPGGVSVRRIISAMLNHYNLTVEVIAVPERFVPNKVLVSLGIPSELKAYMNRELNFDDSEFARRVQDFSYPRFQDYSNLMFTFADQYLFGEGGSS